MKKTNKLICVLLALVFVLSFALTACNGDEPAASTNGTNPATQPSESKPSQTQPTEPNQTPPSDPAVSLEITVTPAELEIYAGEEIDLMFGVTVNNAEASLRISDDNDFDYETPGTYTITYEAVLGDVKVNATRTVIVNEALSNIALEVTHNHLGANKWEGNVISFPHAMYVELSANTELSKQSGVFKNVSDGEIILSIEGGYGCSAIIDGNGVVIEGRDGANSKLVNAQNPTRAGSSATNITIGEESVTVASAFAKQMVIPAGGYAIVVQANEFGTTADSDGRGFMNYNVIREIGNVVRLYWVDTDETLTPYVNQQPTVTGNNKILAQMGDETFDLNAAVIAGIVAKDDNGTFSLDDDVTLETVTIVDIGGFDINNVGTYIVTLSVTDGELTAEFTREIEVKSDGIGTLTIGENVMNIALERVAIDKELSATGGYAFIIYTSNYEGTIGFANGYGVAIVLDEYGTIVRIYDGASGKYFDAANDGVTDGTCTPAGYATEAFNSLQDGETLIIAPNSSENNAAGGSRAFLYSNRKVGATVSGLGLAFQPTGTVLTIGDKSFTAEDGKWLYNADVTAAQAAQNSMLIFDKNYTGTVEINGFGCAIVLDKYGTLVKIYDAANGGFWTVEGKSADPLTFTTSNYATVAFTELQEGELLIIFPNDGGANEARAFGLSLRNVGGDCYCGQIATLTGFTFEEKVG